MISCKKILRLVQIILLALALCASSHKALANTGTTGTAINPTAALSLYFIGMGSTYLVEWLMDSLGEQAFAPNEITRAHRPLGKAEQESESLKLEAQSTTIKSLKQGLYTGLRIYLEKLLGSVKTIPQAEIKKLMRSYDAGTMIDYLLFVKTRALDLLNDMAKAGIESGKQLGTITLKGVQFQIGQLLKQLLDTTKTPSPYRYTLDYPLKATGATVLNCGPGDRYCVQKLSATEQELITPEIKELTESAEKFVLSSTRLMLQAGTLSVGILFAYLSFQVGLAVSQFLVSTTLPESALAPAIQTIVQKTIARAIEVTTAERLKDWFIKIINKTKLLEQQENIQTDVIIVPELETILKTSSFGVVAKEAALPAQVEHLDYLRPLLNLRLS